MRSLSDPSMTRPGARLANHRAAEWVVSSPGPQVTRSITDTGKIAILLQHQPEPCFSFKLYCGGMTSRVTFLLRSRGAELFRWLRCKQTIPVVTAGDSCFLCSGACTKGSPLFQSVPSISMAIIMPFTMRTSNQRLEPSL